LSLTLTLSLSLSLKLILCATLATLIACPSAVYDLQIVIGAIGANRHNPTLIIVIKINHFTAPKLTFC
jgi:hypothetical protein